MRASKTDKYVCIIMLVIFIYSFFIIGASYVYCDELPYWGYQCREDEVIALEWSTAVYISPVAFLGFFFLILFHKELLPVNRRWVKHHIKQGLKWVKWKLKKGLDEYMEW